MSTEESSERDSLLITGLTAERDSLLRRHRLVCRACQALFPEAPAKPPITPPTNIGQTNLIEMYTLGLKLGESEEL